MLGRNYSETCIDIFTNFGIDVKHHQTMCNVLILRTIKPPTVCMDLCPFIVFSTEIVSAPYLFKQYAENNNCYLGIAQCRDLVFHSFVCVSVNICGHHTAALLFLRCLNSFPLTCKNSLKCVFVRKIVYHASTGRRCCCCCCIVVYVHGKHLRSCRDGQLT